MGDEPETKPVAGASAQAEFERLESARYKRIRDGWPLMVGVGLVIVNGVFLFVLGVTSQWGWTTSWLWAGCMAMVAALGVLVLLTEVPDLHRAYRKGAEGERTAGRHLDGLGEAGFVALHDRRVPGYGGNLDHVVIGPTGVWAVETKALRGKVQIEGDELRIGKWPQDRAIDQVYKEAVAIQVALRDLLDPLGLTVTPIICLTNADMPWFNKTVRGVRLASGRQLVRALREAEPRLDGDAVQALAAEANRRLRANASG